MGSDIVLPLAMFGLPLIFLILQLRALARWQGISGALAKVSAGAALLWLIVFVVQVSVDPTSHNLWPFEAIMVSLAGLAWLSVIAIGRRLAKGSAR